MNLKPYYELCKPRITLMIVIMAALGFILGKGSLSNFDILFYTIVGTALSCGGAATLNNYLEWEQDSQMKRTKNRAIPRGAVPPHLALCSGVVLVVLGTAFLVQQVNLLTGYLALLTAFLYVLVYTPLKRYTWLNTLIGAIPGAMPPLGGWSAATGSLSLGAWSLFAILFIWQHPHFYSIAWLYKDDYARASFKMLPNVDDKLGNRTFFQILAYSIVLIPISLLPYLAGFLSKFYFINALLLGMAFLLIAVYVYLARTNLWTKRLLLASVIYLPLLFSIIVIDLIIA